MKVSIDWLKDYVDLDISPGELKEKLDLSGTAVESVGRIGGDFEGVVVGKISKIEPHPNADSLVLVSVDVGDQDLSIVCGAKNMKEGDRVAVAKAQAILKGEKLKKAKIRGVESEGMICSAVELGLGEDASGIMIIDSEVGLGRSLGEALGLDDTILELEITPNRPDCLSMIGIAREVSALTGKELKKPSIGLKDEGQEVSARAEVEIDDPDLCPRYVARVIDGVKIAPSPDWMQRRLKAAGIRPISNVVDVTNYVMLEMGQPLHAFDLAKIKDGKIIVRRARDNETITTLDDVERSLNSTILAITDPSGPIALAGVMGGSDSEVSSETRAILLESAHFNAANISRTSRDLGLISESSLRFERGSDPNGAPWACDRAAELIKLVAGGEVLKGRIDVYPKKIEPKELNLRVNRVNQILGTNLAIDNLIDILTSLEIAAEVAMGGEIKVAAPTFRPDLTREIDLIEEIARTHGYNKIESTLPRGEAVGGLTLAQKIKKMIAGSLISAGLFETMSYTFVSPDYLRGAGLEGASDYEGAMWLKNPLGEEQAVLRTTLIPSLLETVKWNLNRKNDNVKIFEMARVFKEQEGEELPKESLMVSAALAGASGQDHWYSKAIDIDFYDIKGVIEKLLLDLHIREYQFKRVDHLSLHPSMAAELFIKSRSAGILGKVHPKVAAAYELGPNVAIFELSVDSLIQGVDSVKKFEDIPRFPGINLDISMLVGDLVTHQEVIEVILKSGGKLLKDARLFDLYRGEELGAGRKSLAYSLLFQSMERTLTDDEAAKAIEAIVSQLKEKLSAEIRQS
ncbi:MAG: phenylalanine--tRNA ligase subunit beta [Actinomycetota bacterium]|nr:phenylalanine--tRNA ligase subunit beta [Actinomycetota bacterium]